MSEYVASVYSFPVLNEGPLSSVAVDTKAQLDSDGESEFYWMLSQVASDPQRFVQAGGKGRMFVWGSVWKRRTDATEFGIDDLPYRGLTYFHLSAWKHGVISAAHSSLLVAAPEDFSRTFIYRFDLTPDHPSFGPPEERSILHSEFVIEGGWLGRSL